MEKQAKTSKEILNIHLFNTDASIAPISIRQYLYTLLRDLWIKEDGFSGKRPFGNSGWKYEIFIGLIREGVIEGSLDENGYLEDCDDAAGDKVILACIDEIFTGEKLRGE